MGDSEILSKIENHFNLNRAQIKSKKENRKNFVKKVNEYYSDRLSLEMNHSIKEKLLKDDLILIETSHGAQLGHLGIVRLFLKGAQILWEMDNSLVYFLVGDQYLADMYPEINKVYFPKTGIRNEPFVIPVGKKNKRKPLFEVPVPEEKDINKLMNQIMGNFGPNIHYFCESNNINKNELDKNVLKERMSWLKEILVDSLKVTSNFADWTTRVQIKVLEKFFPGLMEDKIFFFPISMLPELDGFRQLSNEYEDINRWKNEISAIQKGQAITPYSEKEVPGLQSQFWYHCPKCHTRNKGIIFEGYVDYNCYNCHSEIRSKISDGFKSPDIVFSQIFTSNFLGLTGRIVGHVHSYAQVADEFMSQKQGFNPPMRLTLNTHPIFHGAGDPPEGEGRCSLIRAAVEADQDSMENMVKEDWDNNPVINSFYVKYLEVK